LPTLYLLEAEMHDTPPPPPIHQRDTRTLVEDLCVELRNVGVYDSGLPDGSRVLAAIGAVREIAAELGSRGVDYSARLAELSEQTRWRMADLLADCLAFPKTTPYVRATDGIRRTLRCGLCRQADYPPGASQRICDDCPRRVVNAIEQRSPIDGIVLFRTYSPRARCTHADSETVLAVVFWTDDVDGQCRTCFQDELDRRGRQEQPG
jgi:hypothetical protein